MCCKMICMFLVAAFAAQENRSVKVNASPALESLMFETQRGDKCELKISGAATVGNRTASIVCDGKTLFRKSTGGYLVDVQKALRGDDHFFIRWEEGHSNTLQALRVVPDATNKDSVVEVLNISSEFMPEIIDNPDDVLVYGGKRFGQNGDILPTTTDLLSWQDGKYVPAARWLWKESMSFDQRFCILHPNSECPATLQQKQ